MIKVSESNWLSETPSEKELSRLSIDELINLCTYKKRIKHPFKKVLIDYLMQLEKL